MEISLTQHRSPIRLDACNLATSFSLIGDKWTLLVLRSALYGVRRFDDFSSELDIPRSVLSNRLKRLIANGLMVRSNYTVPGARARPEYILTKMGEELRLPFFAMTQWADEWLGSCNQKPLTLRTKVSQLPVRIAMVDNRGAEVQNEDFEVHFANWARAVEPEKTSEL